MSAPTPAETMDHAPARLRPTVVDRGSSGFFAEAAQGRLSVLTCTSCGKRIHLPRPRCVYCGGTGPVWQPVARTGTVYAHTVVEHQVHPLFPVPYTVIVVDVDGTPEGEIRKSAAAIADDGIARAIRTRVRGSNLRTFTSRGARNTRTAGQRCAI